MNSYWVDIHTHRPLDGRPGIRSLRVGTDFPDSTDGKISAGIHPWDAERAQREWLDGIRELQPAAVGEVGLDYATDIDREAQRTWLARQRDLAAELGLPLIVHCVRAYDDLKAMLSGFPLPVIVHGFTGSEQLASQLLDRGWYLSFGKTVVNGRPKPAGRCEAYLPTGCFWKPICPGRRSSRSTAGPPTSGTNRPNRSATPFIRTT